MTKKTLKLPPLRLRIEVARVLTTDQLAKAAGGRIANSNDNPSACKTCAACTVG